MTWWILGAGKWLRFSGKGQERTNPTYTLFSAYFEIEQKME